MGICKSKISNCFGSSSSQPSTTKQKGTSLGLHKPSQKYDGLKSQKVLSEEQQQLLSKHKHSKNSSNEQQEKVRIQNEQHQNGQQNSINKENDDAHQRVMKKIDSSRYLLKHSNLSLIIEEDEHALESLKLKSQSSLIEAKKEESKLKDTDQLQQNNVSSLSQIENISFQSPENKKKTHFNEENCDELSSNKEEMLQKLEYYSGEKSNKNMSQIQMSKQITEDKGNINLEDVLPNYQEIGNKAERTLSDFILTSYELGGYEQDCNEKYQGEHNTQFYFKIFSKPDEDSRYKFFKIRSEFNLCGVSAVDYMRLTLDEKHSKKNNQSIDEMKHICCKNDYHLVYIAYKKVLLASPRDFIYLKMNKQIDKNTYITIQQSIEIKDYPPYKGKERASIILSGSLISEYVDKQSNKPFLQLINFTETNLKLTINHKYTKTPTIKEFKNYITNTQKLFNSKEFQSDLKKYNFLQQQQQQLQSQQQLEQEIMREKEFQNYQQQQMLEQEREKQLQQQQQDQQQHQQLKQEQQQQQQSDQLQKNEIERLKEEEQLKIIDKEQQQEQKQQSSNEEEYLQNQQEQQQKQQIQQEKEEEVKNEEQDKEKKGGDND